MDGGGECTVTVGGEGHSLPADGSVSDGGVHLRPGQREFHRPAHLPGGVSGEELVRPGLTGAAEGAADEGRDDADAVGGDAEGVAVGLLAVVDALDLVPHRELVAVPRGDRGGNLHRVVVVAGDRVRPVDDDGGAAQRGVGVAAGVVGTRLARFAGGVGVVEVGVLRFFAVPHRHQSGTVGGGLEGGRDDDRHRLSEERHPRRCRRAALTPPKSVITRSDVAVIRGRLRCRWPSIVARETVLHTRTACR